MSNTTTPDSPWPARWAGLKAALIVLVLGFGWMFVCLVLTNGLEYYGGGVLTLIGIMWLAGVVLLPWGVMWLGRRLQLRMSAQQAATKALRLGMMVFWPVLFLHSCGTMVVGGSCEQKGLLAPGYCVMLKR